MVEELDYLIEGFLGAAARVQCFNHIINLSAKSIIQQFDSPKKSDGEDLGDPDALMEDFEDEEYEESDRVNPDNTDRWIDERDEMSENEVEELELDTKPLRFTLLKVSLT